MLHWQMLLGMLSQLRSIEKEEKKMSFLTDYFAFAQEHPELFVNPPQGGFTILLEEKEIQEVEAQMKQKLAARGLPVAWSQVGIVYQDQHGRILRDAVRFPGGALGTYI